MATFGASDPDGVQCSSVNRIAGSLVELGVPLFIRVKSMTSIVNIWGLSVLKLGLLSFNTHSPIHMVCRADMLGTILSGIATGPCHHVVDSSKGIIILTSITVNKRLRVVIAVSTTVRLDSPTVWLTSLF